MAALPGKYARFNCPSGTPVVGSFRWNVGFRRERLDTTNFESATDAAGINVFSDGATGVLDTTFQVEVYNQDVAVDFFFPQQTLICDLLFRKNVPLGYTGINADVLDFSPSTEVRGIAKSTVQLQSNGLYNIA